MDLNVKPKKCRYPDCFNCTYADCRWNGIEWQEIVRQDRFDKELEIVEPEILRMRQKNKRYEMSLKGKQRHKRYEKAEKGKINAKKKAKRRIQSGKNAEYCRRYYQKIKMQKLLKLIN